MMILGLGIVVVIIAVLLWALRIAVSVAAIIGLVGLVILIIGFVSSRIGRRSANR